MTKQLTRPYHLPMPKGSLGPKDSILPGDYVAGWWIRNDCRPNRVSEGRVDIRDPMAYIESDLYFFRNYWDAWAYQLKINELERNNGN